MKNILITGGAGFIGSHAVEHFLTHFPTYHIINLDKLTYAGSMENMLHFYDHPKHIFIKGDITDFKLLEKMFVDYDISDVIHFAAESHVDNSIESPEVFIKTNVLGTYHLLETARKFWKGNKNHRFHHISTDEVYGSLGETGYFTENSPYAPNSPYSASKASSDHLVRSYGKTYDLNVVISHCSNNYGPRQHAEKLIPTIIRKALSGQSIPLYGTGTNVRDWIFVKDHCKAIDLIFHQAPMGETFNIGGNNELSNKELTLFLCGELNKLYPNQLPYETLIQYVSDRPGHDFRYAVSTVKIEKTLKWLPCTSFQSGLSQTIESFECYFQKCEV